MILETAFDHQDERLELVWSFDGHTFLGCLKTLKNSETRTLTIYEAWRETKDPSNRKTREFPCRDDALDFLSRAP